MKYKLSEVVDITMGQSPKSKYYNTDGNGYPFLQGNRTFGFKYPTFDTYTTVMTKSAKAGDVIMSVRAPVGDLNITPVDMCLGRGVCSLRMKNGNQDFLFYMMKYYVSYLTQKESGTVFGSVNRNDINSLEIDIPDDVEKQQVISRYLSMLDDKIALNTAINENLEQQAQAIFKSWFVDFEPFDGVMPNDWKTGTLSDICGYSKDKVNLENLTVDTYYSTENMQSNRQGAVQATTLPAIKQTTACKKGDVLVSNIRPYFKKIVYCFSDCGCSTDVLCFVPNKVELSVFLYCALYSDKFFDYMVAGAKGTKMPRGDKQQIMMYPICIPSTKYIEQFDQAVAPMLETVYTNRIEAKNLSNLRDTLLPKLMNGEIDVSEVEI